MQLTHRELRKRIQEFYETRGHKEAPPAPLVLSGDATTLFTSSGMQPLVPYLMGQPHPSGKRLWNIQPCIRTQDIEEVGDNRHDTFFEMVGNWSLGDYFKKDQLPWMFDLYTNKKYGFGLDPQKLYVTVFAGGNGVPKDEEAIEIWKEIFKKAGLEAQVGTQETWHKNQRITLYGAHKNWWSRSGPPELMPAGEIGGPDSELFYDFGEELHDESLWGNPHPNSDSGRFLEIGNSVFIQYKKREDGTLEELPQKNVDFGGGFERILAAMHHNPDVFTTDVFYPIIQTAEAFTGASYRDNQKSLRIIADHLKTATFLIVQGVEPSHKEHGYVLRRLLRRACVELHTLKGKLTDIEGLDAVADAVLTIYDGVQGIERVSQAQEVKRVIKDEVDKFARTLDRGLREIHKLKTINGKAAFDLYQTYGFPWELTRDLMKQKGIELNEQEFKEEFEKHKEASRTASAGMFKGGLADNSEQVKKYHTATHLINQALTDIFGADVRQEGSNITGERLRFDFYTRAQNVKENMPLVEKEVNNYIRKALPVRNIQMPKEEALRIGARSFFKEKYPDIVSVYYIGGEEGNPKDAYSKEFCGGPHANNTSEIGSITIVKVEKIGSNTYRLYAK